MQARLAPSELQSIQALPAKNLEMYEYFKKGKYFWDVSHGFEGNLKAAEMFEKACQLDTTFVQAYAWLSLCYRAIYTNVQTLDIKNQYKQNKKALSNAITWRRTRLKYT